MSDPSVPSYLKVDYSLRPAKNIYRKLLRDHLQRLHFFSPLSDYQYIGFGSIYFTDFSLFHRSLGISRMTSIEANKTDVARVCFNRPFSCIDIRMGRASEVLPSLDWSVPAIVWLDYDAPLSHEVLNDISVVCGRASKGSVLVVTVDGERKRLESPPADSDSPPDDWPSGIVARLERWIGRKHVPSGLRPPTLRANGLPDLYANVMFDHIREQVSTRADGVTSHPFLQCLYSDGNKMVSVGVVFCGAEDAQGLLGKGLFRWLETGANPMEILPPKLTLREAAALSQMLPTEDPEGLEVPVPGADKAWMAKWYRYFPRFTETEL